MIDYKSKSKAEKELRKDNKQEKKCPIFKAKCVKEKCMGYIKGFIITSKDKIELYKGTCKYMNTQRGCHDIRKN